MGHISQQASLLKSTLDIGIERDSCPKMFSQLVTLISISYTFYLVGKGRHTMGEC